MKFTRSSISFFVLYLAFVSLSLTSYLQAQDYAITKDGRTVILKRDGTWQNVEIAAEEKEILAYLILGREAARKQKWDEATSHFEKVLVLNPPPSVKAEAYFYIGMARWKESDFEEAMSLFAKGSVQKGAPYAQACRQQLELLVRSQNKDIYDPPMPDPLPPQR